MSMPRKPFINDSLAEQVFGPGEEDDSAQIERRQRQPGRRVFRFAEEGYRPQRSAGHGVGFRVLVVKYRALEHLSGRCRLTGDHVAELAGDVQVPAAVVAHVDDQVLDSAGHIVERAECVDQPRLGGSQVVVEEHVTNGGAGGGCHRAHMLDRRGSYDLRDQ